jgi:SPOR domain
VTHSLDWSVDQEIARKADRDGEVMWRALLGLILFLSATGPAVAQQASGWWVVIASFSAENTSAMAAEFEQVNAAAARCGLRAFNDFSAKFRGFRPGYNVFVIGPYPSHSDANNALATAKRCIPAAYVKYGEYLGE